MEMEIPCTTTETQWSQTQIIFLKSELYMEQISLEKGK